jgi:hypothetical protein
MTARQPNLFSTTVHGAYALNDLRDSGRVVTADRLSAPAAFRPQSKCWRIVKLFQAHGWRLSGETINRHPALARKWTNRVSDIRARVGDVGCVVCSTGRAVNAAGEHVTTTVYEVPDRYRPRLRALAPWW